MAKYTLLASYTQQGIANVKESSNRAEAARGLARECGAELTDLYLTLGGYDIVGILKAPTDEAAATFALALGSLGNVRTKTLKSFTEDQFREIVQISPVTETRSFGSFCSAPPHAGLSFGIGRLVN